MEALNLEQLKSLQKNLTNAAGADFYYDAVSYGDEKAANSISKAREAMEETAHLLGGLVSDLSAGKTLFAVDEQQHATLIAALRYYQEQGMGDPNKRSDAIHDIATNCGEVTSLDDRDIDDLVDQLNVTTQAHSRDAEVYATERYRKIVCAANLLISEDVDQPGKYCWSGAEISYNSEFEALQALAREITSDVMGAENISDEYWDAMSLDEQLEVIREACNEHPLIDYPSSL